MLRSAARLLPCSLRSPGVTPAWAAACSGNSHWQGRHISTGSDEGASTSATADDAASILEQAAQVVEASGAGEAAALLAAKADSWVVTRAFMDSMAWLEAGAGWPWWASIVVVNIATRMLSLPVTVLTQKKMGSMMEIRRLGERMKALNAASSSARTVGEFDRLQAQSQAAYAELQTKHGHNMKWVWLTPLLTLGNGIMFFSQFNAVRGLAMEQVPSMAHGGLSWFGDLTVPDPTFALPIACAVLTLGMVESGAMASEMGGAQAANLKWLMRVVAVAMVPAGAYFPAAVTLLWLSNSMWSLGQAGLLRAPRARAALGLPTLEAQAAAAAAAAARAGGGAAPAAQAGGLVGAFNAMTKGVRGAAEGAARAEGAAMASAEGSRRGGAAAGPATGAGTAAGGGREVRPPMPGTRPSKLLTHRPPGAKGRR